MPEKNNPGRKHYEPGALMRTPECTEQFVRALEASLKTFKFAYPLTERNLNMEQLWEVYTAIFDLDIGGSNNNNPLDFSHVQQAQTLVQARIARHWWLVALPDAVRATQRLLLARGALPLAQWREACSASAALLVAKREGLPQREAVARAVGASSECTALLRGSKVRRSFRHAAESEAAAASVGLYATHVISSEFEALRKASRDASALVKNHRASQRVLAAREGAAQVAAIARAHTERALFALNVLCAAWCQPLVQGTRACAPYRRLLAASCRAQGAFRAAATQRAQGNLANAALFVQTVLREKKAERQQKEERQRLYDAECERIREEQKEALKNDELASIQVPYKRPQWASDKDNPKCQECCQPFTSSNRRVCSCTTQLSPASSAAQLCCLFTPLVFVRFLLAEKSITVAAAGVWWTSSAPSACRCPTWATTSRCWCACRASSSSTRDADGGGVAKTQRQSHTQFRKTQRKITFC